MGDAMGVREEELEEVRFHSGRDSYLSKEGSEKQEENFGELNELQQAGSAGLRFCFFYSTHVMQRKACS